MVQMTWNLKLSSHQSQLVSSLHRKVFLYRLGNRDKGHDKKKKA